MVKRDNQRASIMVYDLISSSEGSSEQLNINIIKDVKRKSNRNLNKDMTELYNKVFNVESIISTILENLSFRDIIRFRTVCVLYPF